MAYKLGGVAVVALCAVLIGAAPQANGVPIVTLSLAHYPRITRLAAGESVGIAPGQLRVHVGARIVFVNGDVARHHTATAIVNAGSFSGDPRWTDTALNASGNINGGQWSTGDLAPGARSAPLLAAKPGTYLYGCFFHYSAGMRAEIVVEP
ncbi:MAG: hypothetical protein M3007_03115 [Candidatus Eremiobacteraeota bacterium]|nr:hypothetical protein [Candidatus Eremiobacteraeota bacterium]